MARREKSGGTEWTRQERGWYTSGVGGICLEKARGDRKAGWYFYPRNVITGACDSHHSVGPFATLEDAQLCADEWRRSEAPFDMPVLEDKLTQHLPGEK